MRLYKFIYYCFYILFKKSDAYKHEGANAYISIVFISLLFSIHFWIAIIFEREVFNDKLEMLSGFILSLIIWFSNRIYFVNKKNGETIVHNYFQKNIKYKKTIAILLLIVQLLLFIYSGINFSFYLRTISI